MKQTDYLERRNFFRVEDECVINCKPVSDEEYDRGILKLRAGELELPDVSRLFLSLEATVQDKIAKIKDENVQATLDIINRKLNLMANGGLINSEYKNILEQRPEPVSLSASGVGFMHETPFEEGTKCQVELVLLPSKTYIFAYGYITSSFKGPLSDDERALGESQWYRSGLAFDYMREDDMERLIQHIMRVEAKLIRQSRKNL